MSSRKVTYLTNEVSMLPKPTTSSTPASTTTDSGTTITTTTIVVVTSPASLPTVFIPTSTSITTSETSTSTSTSSTTSTTSSTSTTTTAPPPPSPSKNNPIVTLGLIIGAVLGCFALIGIFILLDMWLRPWQQARREDRRRARAHWRDFTAAHDGPPYYPPHPPPGPSGGWGGGGGRGHGGGGGGFDGGDGPAGPSIPLTNLARTRSYTTGSGSVAGHDQPPAYPAETYKRGNPVEHDFTGSSAGPSSGRGTVTYVPALVPVETQR